MSKYFLNNLLKAWRREIRLIGKLKLIVHIVGAWGKGGEGVVEGVESGNEAGGTSRMYKLS